MKPRPPSPIPNIPIPGDDPAGLGNALVWWDASTLLSTLGDGDTASFISDRSLNGKHGTQPTSTREPTLRTGVLNGLPVLEFASEDFLLSPDVTAPSQGTTLYLVMRRINSFVFHGSFAGFGNQAATEGNDEISILEDTAGDISWYANSVFGYSTIAAGVATAWSVIALVFENTTSCIPYRNAVAGTAFNQNVSLDAQNCPVFIGASNGSGIWYGANCQIPEMIWYDRAHSPSQVGTTTAYFRNKYGL
jgi:hypothetical protein